MHAQCTPHANHGQPEQRSRKWEQGTPILWCTLAAGRGMQFCNLVLDASILVLKKIPSIFWNLLNSLIPGVPTNLEGPLRNCHLVANSPLLRQFILRVQYLSCMQVHHGMLPCIFHWSCPTMHMLVVISKEDILCILNWHGSKLFCIYTLYNTFHRQAYYTMH